MTIDSEVDVEVIDVIGLSSFLSETQILYLTTNVHQAATIYSRLRIMFEGLIITVEHQDRIQNYNTSPRRELREGRFDVVLTDRHVLGTQFLNVIGDVTHYTGIETVDDAVNALNDLYESSKSQ